MDLNGILAEVDRLLARVAGGKVPLSVVAGDGLWPVSMGRRQVEQILVNLSVNARAAMPDGGALRFATSNEVLDEEFTAARVDLGPGEYVRLSAQHPWGGMDRATLRQIFEPFLTIGEGVDTGLGLAAVYGVVKQAGGYAEATLHPGEGVRFDLYLPRSTEPLGEAPAPAGRAAAFTHPTGTVLVVEDDGPLRRLIRRILERNGYPVVDTGDPEEAIRICTAAGQPVALLITDVVMPGMDGRDLADALHERFPALPVIFISGYSSAILEQRPFPEEAQFLRKPFSVDELRGLVHHVIGTARP